MKNIRIISSLIIILFVGCAVYLTLSSLNSTISSSDKKNIILIPNYALKIEKSLTEKSCRLNCFEKLNHSKEWENIEKNSTTTSSENIYKVTIQLSSELNFLTGPLALMLAYYDFEEIDIWTKGGRRGSYQGGASVKDFIKIPIDLKDYSNELSLILITKSTSRNLLFFNSLVFLGGTSSLTNVLFHTEREKVTTPLLYIMLSITFIVIFLLFQFLSKKEDLYWKQVVLALLSSVSIFLTSYLPLSFIDQNNIFYYFIILRTVWSLTFIYIFLDIAKLKSSIFKISTIFFHLLLLCVVTYFQLKTTPENETFRLSFSTLVILPVLVSLISVLVKIKNSRKQKKKGVYLSYLSGILSLLLLSGITLISTSDLSMIYYFDFFVLLLLSFNSILEFRLNEKTIEKQREQLISLAQDSAISFTAKAMAHDLRKPLSQISSILENILIYKEDPKLLTDVSHQMNRNIAHSERLLSSLLDFSKEGSIEMSLCSPRELINESILILRDELDSRNITLNLNFLHRSKVLCNSSKIERVITNIIQNAVEISTTDKVIIETTQLEEDILFKITNTGSFIEEDDRKKVFENFYSKGKSNGTGLGLASCKKNLELHNKNIWVESDRAKNETTFFFQLEAGKDLDTEKERKDFPTDNTTKEIIVLSCNDDLLTNINLETTFTRVIEQSFQGISLTFQSFATGEELLERVNSYPSALLLCDYDLHERGGILNGLEVIEVIEREYKGIEAYLMTGWDFSEKLDVKYLSSRFLREDCVDLIRSHLSFLDQRTR
ncbi:hybrid sensor histidine kinase/response regulator [Halobacteriovorax sp. JY17]|uniref:hybrid sensor histidine kinase/response regulator n=1 Tax=Halobacteriovorax sp. JY17 TaxID=2014617 RepID=UPI000C6B0445|nr:hybrid sensor histidine kinase/response regulator [Halobacteriovorax sp. JY17]PIK15609.1 MAG: hypothetical protein CES88_02475 [Halobacteriovorax sp. JY17]